MPLDTPITIRLEAEGRRADEQDVADGVMIDGMLVIPGDYIPGPVTEYPVWSDQTNSGSTDTVTGAGSVVVEVRTFTVRWFTELADHRTDLITLNDEYGNRWDIESVGIGRDRRRALQIVASKYLA